MIYERNAAAQAGAFKQLFIVWFTQILLAYFIIYYSMKDVVYEDIIALSSSSEMDMARLVTMVLTHILLQE